MLITLIMILTINGQEFRREEPIPNLEQCWRMAAERMEQLETQHGGRMDTMGVGCVINHGKKL